MPQPSRKDAIEMLHDRVLDLAESERMLSDRLQALEANIQDLHRAQADLIDQQVRKWEEGVKADPPKMVAAGLIRLRTIANCFRSSKPSE